MSRTPPGTRVVVASLAVVFTFAIQAPAAAQPGYLVIEIAPAYSPAMAVNDHGVVVGLEGGSIFESGRSGYVWTRSEGKRPMETALLAPGRPMSVNSRGTVGGTFCADPRCAAGGTPATWQDVTVTFLGNVPNGTHAYAAAMNEAGVVVGESFGNPPGVRPI